MALFAADQTPSSDGDWSISHVESECLLWGTSTLAACRVGAVHPDHRTAADALKLCRSTGVCEYAKPFVTTYKT
jgi:hypothetical protein